MGLCCLFWVQGSVFCAYIFASLWVAGWPHFGRGLLARLAMCFLCVFAVCNFGCFTFLFLRCALAPFLGHCLLVTPIPLLNLRQCF